MANADAGMGLWAIYVSKNAPKGDMGRIVTTFVDVLPTILKYVVIWMEHAIAYQVWYIYVYINQMYTE